MKADHSHTIKRTLAALALVCATALCASAQTHAQGDAAATPLTTGSLSLVPTLDAAPATPHESPTPEASPAPAKRADHESKLEHDFVKNVLRDQRAIWTSPFRLGHGDARRLAPLGLSTVALLATDQETDEFGSARTRMNVSRDVSFAGSVYSTSAVAATFYVVGRATHARRACSARRRSLTAASSSPF
jgi:hypothetical protein